MIKLFRNIRKNLLNEGKTSKYFKYALGEIILVVIGILIALQLNTWKDWNNERKAEKAYALSMIKDVKKDIQSFDAAIELNEERFKSLDALAKLCFNYDQKTDAQIYLMFKNCLRHPDFVSQTDRTLMQLKNAGGMQLITKPTTSDSIVQYEAFFKKLTNQQRWYEDMQKEVAEIGVLLVNFKFYPDFRTSLSKEELNNFIRDAKLVTQDEKLIIEFGNKASLYKGITNFYLYLLKEGKVKSINLIKTLQEDYQLK